MPRAARVLSDSEMYHIYFFGNGNELLFAETADFEQFVSMLFDVDGLTVYAFGLEKRDGHLFVKSPDLPAAMKKLMTRYAMWFNRKYSRRGALFGSRYKSEPIAEKFVPAAARYVVQRGAYNSLTKFRDGTMDFDFLLSYFDSERAFFEFMKEREGHTYGADSSRNSAEIEESFNKILDNRAFLSLSNKERAEAVERLSNAGISKSEIARLAGVSRGTVVRAVRLEEENKRAENRRRNEELVLL